MKTENLIKACDSFDFFASELREAHTDAVNSGSKSAEGELFSLIEAAIKLDTKLHVVREAVTRANAAKKKGRK